MPSVKFEGKRQKTTLNMDFEEEKTTKKVVFRRSGGEGIKERSVPLCFVFLDWKFLDDKVCPHLVGE